MNHWLIHTVIFCPELNVAQNFFFNLNIFILQLKKYISAQINFSLVTYIWIFLHIASFKNNDILFAYRKPVVKD